MRVAPRPPPPPPSTSCRCRHALEHSGTFASFTDERAVLPTRSSSSPVFTAVVGRELVSSSVAHTVLVGSQVCDALVGCGAYQSVTLLGEQGGRFVGGLCGGGGVEGMPRGADECLGHVVSPSTLAKRQWREAKPARRIYGKAANGPLCRAFADWRLRIGVCGLWALSVGDARALAAVADFTVRFDIHLRMAN